MKFVVCLDNHDYPASLERGKPYPVLEDARGAKLGMVRIVDESGEDYRYPAPHGLRPSPSPARSPSGWRRNPSGLIATAATGRLPPHGRLCCGLLCGGALAATAREIGIPRPTGCHRSKLAVCLLKELGVATLRKPDFIDESANFGV
jgi:hypothetical protein